MTNNKTLYIIIAVVVVLVIGIGAWWFMQGNGVVPSFPSFWFAGTQSNSNNGTTGKLSYEAAVKLYGNRRIQFDEACELVPNNVTFKTGTSIMLDNRSAKNTVISLDNVDYNISAYGYIVVTLTSPTLPHTVMVGCGKGQNNAQIILQK